MLEPPEVHEPKLVRGLMLVVAVGFFIVFVALLLLNWPSGQWGEQDVTLLPQIQRTTDAIRGQTALPTARLVLDIGIYFVVVIGVGFMIAAWRGSRGALIGLLVISVLGLSYVSNMALYIGPMVSTCGFILILFGGLVAWASLPRHNLVEEPAATPIDDRGTDEYASHPVA